LDQSRSVKPQPRYGSPNQSDKISAIHGSSSTQPLAYDFAPEGDFAVWDKYVLVDPLSFRVSTYKHLNPGIFYYFGALNRFKDSFSQLSA
jgi:hypothetical protein